eukprot:Lithocolla_globosa_v1_NODE_8351_length_831_cov_3.760309.p1 type:complete len:103 gc:universal NODE_8351_length_831_cov_3.760309:438-746(+)
MAPQEQNPERLSSAVKALMNHSKSFVLLDFLEAVLFNNSTFNKNKNLQNLILLTAAKVDSSRVMKYVIAFSDYDGPQIAKVLESAEVGLTAEAQAIFEKDIW